MKFGKRWIAFVVLFFMFSISIGYLWADEAIVRGSLKEKGEKFITLKVSEAGIFKAGSSQTFYIHAKTKILVARSGTLLTMGCLLTGDAIQVTLGKIGKTKDGKMIRYVEKIIVLSPRQVNKK